jgi:DNA polymerase-3 subunit beta
MTGFLVITLNKERGYIMKITMNTNDFIIAAKVLEKVPDNEILPELNLILITAKDGKVKLTKTNIDNTINVYFPTDIDSYGTFFLSKKTIEMLKNLKEDTITITESTIKTEKKTIAYNQIDVKEYPELIKRDFGENFFELSEKELNRMLDVKYCIGDDKSRPILCGVCFNGNETVGIDGYRMSVREGSYNSNVHNVVIDLNTINLLNKVINKNSIEKVKVSGKTFDGRFEQFVKFEFSNIEVIGKTIEGEYFNYKNFVPQNFETKITINVAEILSEIEFMYKASNKEEPDIIKLVTENDKLLLRCILTEMEYNKEASIKETQRKQNEADEEYNILMEKYRNKQINKKPIQKTIKAVKVYTKKEVSQVNSEIITSISGEDILMGFNIRYIYEALKQVTVDNVMLKAYGNCSPMIITADSNNFEMILPVRL